VITIHRHRRTDRQTTCDRNTALCTKVHRAVKITGGETAFNSRNYTDGAYAQATRKPTGRIGGLRIRDREHFREVQAESRGFCRRVTVSIESGQEAKLSLG